MKNPRNFLMLSFTLLAGLFAQMNAMNLVQDEENVVTADDLQNNLYDPSIETTNPRMIVQAKSNNHFSDTQYPNILKLKNAVEAQGRHSQLTGASITTSSASSSRSTSWASTPSSTATSVRTSSPKIHPEPIKTKPQLSTKLTKMGLTQEDITDAKETLVAMPQITRLAQKDAQEKQEKETLAQIRDQQLEKLQRGICRIEKILKTQQEEKTAALQNIEMAEPTSTCGCLPF